MGRIITAVVALWLGLAVVIGTGVVYIASAAYDLFDGPASSDSSAFGERADGTGPRFEFDEDFGEVAVFDVLADGSLEPAAGGVAGEVWNFWLRMVGPDVAAETIIQYRAGDAPDSDTLAYVYQDTNPAYWSLAVNLATAEDPQLLVATLIHEYGHVFSFDSNDFDRKATSCDTLDLFEGCAAADSYLYQFYDRFWAGYGGAFDIENVDDDAAYEFYLENEEDFVSDYAATNLGEDFAESFMTFVIEDVPDGDTVVAQKPQFFTQFSELLELREHIRDELAVELGVR
jgi:hypothetical protein